MEQRQEAMYRCGEWIVVALEGEIDLASANSIENELLALTLGEGSRLIAELSRLAFIDTVGVGMLVRLAYRLRANGGELVLAAAPPHLRRLLQLTGLDCLFPTFASVDEAVIAMVGQRSPP